MSGKIARKETAEFVENIDLVDLLPPGLYELIIEPKRSDTVEGDLIVGNYVTRFEPRTLDDIRAFGVNDPEDDLRFATVARVSEINLGLYDLFLRPWVRAMTTEASAEAMRRMSSIEPNTTCCPISIRPCGWSSRWLKPYGKTGVRCRMTIRT